eukprot:TRINITY_DN2032_c0_g1_i1.p1 TRINITY_DN2032_c0_g1~~TRINITY_DN2032_c0_g1_i1.p1  ORF type:complete len:308 (+),score=91.65 TRINITY_DN2032_c0_g1_i1:191-1114(+)
MEEKGTLDLSLEELMALKKNVGEQSTDPNAPQEATQNTTTETAENASNENNTIPQRNFVGRGRFPHRGRGFPRGRGGHPQFAPFPHRFPAFPAFPGHMRGGHYPVGMQHYPQYPPYHYAPPPQPALPPLSRLTNRLYVGNLPWEVSWQTLKDHFSQVGKVVFADVFLEESGRSKGCGIVEFETKEESLRALKKLNNSVIPGTSRPIFVREDREDKNLITHQKDPSLAGRQVFVGNLSYKTSWQDLKDLFKQYGNVLHADVATTRDGLSKGRGLVLFENAAEAANAIKSLNGTEFQGRLLDVHEDKFA